VVNVAALLQIDDLDQLGKPLELAPIPNLECITPAVSN
jgi:hypothetical protein